MEDSTKVEFKVGINDSVKASLIGKFVLERKMDPRKRQKFRLSNLTSEIPFNSKTPGKRIYFADTYGNPVNSLYIDRVKTYFNPDENPVDKINIVSLMNHSDVRIGSMSNEEHQKLVNAKIKKSNPRYVLTNIDKVKDVKHEDQRSTVKAMSLIYDNEYTSKQLVYLCSLFNLPYSLQETFENAKRTNLESRLLKWVQQDVENAKKLINKIDDITTAEDSWYYDQLIKYGIIHNKDGYYKVADSHKPIGIDKESVIKYLQTEKEAYDMLKVQVQNFIKQETQNL